MATFDTPVQKTNDPSYLGTSRGTDNASLQPLASVPELSTKYVQPDYKASQAAGTAVKGIGDIAEAGLKLTDAVIQQKADDTLNTGIKEIRDSFGVGQAADLSSGIAKAVGQAGAEGVSLTDADSSANQPVALNRLGNKVEGLTESYRQGGLSNSAYYAKLEAFVRETKQQFPGYSDQIDTMVSTKVGVTPANALRSALQNDVAELQKKVQAQNDKWTTYEHTNANIIYNVWPNYDKMKSDGTAPSRLDVEAAVGKQQAVDYKIDFGMKSLAAKKSGDEATSNAAYDLAIQKASDISRNTVIGMANSMGINTSADLNKYIADVNAGTRKPPTPDEQQQLVGLFSILKQKASVAFDTFATTPLAANTTETLASRLRDPAKLAQAKTVALGDISTIEDGLLNEKHGLVAATVSWNKANDALADKDFAIKMPNAQIVGAMHRKIGDQALGNLFIDQGPTLMAGLRKAGWVDIDEANPVTQTLDKLKKSSNNDPAVIKQHLDDSTKMVIHKDELADPTFADRAFRHLFGPGNTTLIDSFQDKVQARVFTDLVSPQMTKAVSKRSKDDQVMYTNWAEDGFASVFQTTANGANQVADSYLRNGNIGKLDLKYNPDSQSFEFSGPNTLPKIAIQSANSKLQPLNSAIAAMKPVFGLTGKDPTAELYRLMPVIGIEPGTPMYKAIQTEVMKQSNATGGNRYSGE